MDKNFESLYGNIIKSALLVEKKLLNELKYSSIQKNEIFKTAEYLQSKQKNEVSKIAEYLQFTLPKTNISLIKEIMNNSTNEKSTQLLKKQKEISDMIINQPFNSMTKQEINTQIQSTKSHINSSIFESLMKDESNQFLKNHTQLFGILSQSFSSIDDKKSILGINNSIFESINQNLFKEREFLNKDFIENLNNFTKELYPDDNLDFDIKYKDIEEINKKIQQKEAFTRNDLMAFDKIISIISLLFAFYVYYFPDDTESIKIQQMINGLDNKISKSLKQELYYETTKQVNVRELADSKSKKIAVAEPKQKLLIIENKPYSL